MFFIINDKFTNNVFGGDALFGDGDLHGVEGLLNDIRLGEDKRLDIVERAEVCRVVLLASFEQLDGGDLVATILRVVIRVLFCFVFVYNTNL